jgi:two-component system LytT family sensor kinase
MKNSLYSLLKKYQLHFIIWFCYIVYEVVMVGLVFNSFGHPATYACHYLLAILLFYFHSGILLPTANKGHTVIIKILLFVIVELCVFLAFSFLIDSLLRNLGIIHDVTSLSLNYQYILKTVYRLVFFISLSTGYHYVLRYNSEKNRTNQLVKQRLEDIIEQQKSKQDLLDAEIKVLRAQINPHFLFNTLDFIYHTVNQTSPLAAEAVISLSEMMRYAINPNTLNGTVRLGDEIDQVQNFLFLSNLKKDREETFRFSYEEELRDVHFIPLVLLTLVENIYKYGDLDNESEAYLSIRMIDQNLCIETSNHTNAALVHQGTKLGLDNIHRRLLNAYGDHITFNYTAGNTEVFFLSITIPVFRLK